MRTIVDNPIHIKKQIVQLWWAFAPLDALIEQGAVTKSSKTAAQGQQHALRGQAVRAEEGCHADSQELLHRQRDLLALAEPSVELWDTCTQGKDCQARIVKNSLCDA